MLEIEQKFTGVNFDELRRRLATLNARPDAPVNEADHYFNAPDRDFRQTGEAFRLRRVGAANKLTYKGARLPTTVRARREMEIALRDGDEAAEEFLRLLEALGFRFTAVVRKHRQPFTLQRDGLEVQVVLDEVEGVGRFAEVEVLAPPEGLEQARQAIHALADELGLTEVEPRSYLRIVLEKRQAAGGLGE